MLHKSFFPRLSMSCLRGGGGGDTCSLCSHRWTALLLDPIKCNVHVFYGALFRLTLQSPVPVEGLRWLSLWHSMTQLNSEPPYVCVLARKEAPAVCRLPSTCASSFMGTGLMSPCPQWHNETESLSLSKSPAVEKRRSGWNVGDHLVLKSVCCFLQNSVIGVAWGCGVSTVLVIWPQLT